MLLSMLSTGYPALAAIDLSTMRPVGNAFTVEKKPDGVIIECDDLASSACTS
jgi:hypothetical protein